jgi:hypothetical protein
MPYFFFIPFHPIGGLYAGFTCQFIAFLAKFWVFYREKKLGLLPLAVNHPRAAVR